MTMADSRQPDTRPAGIQTACPERPPLYVAPVPLSQDGKAGIQRVLIANRGEIACRVIATCRKLNVTTVAVYVEEDSRSLHTRDADEAINLGSIDQEGGNPFLNIDLLVKTAVSVGADAIHPGYGYLSENADFAQAVQDAGMMFIGPGPQAMTTLGDKRMAKDYLRLREPQVPLIPGFSGSSQDSKELERAAREIGYPVMIKASAGGGGRGMRVVRNTSQFQVELDSARSEAARSFGSGDCILEKYIEAGKHIEIQIMGDSHGNVLSLGERDCSIQRRHQKVIEESPCPWLTSEKRQRMSEVAVQIAKLIGYQNAGTVEFVVDMISGNFYFLEVNTRLQVEHPITEEVTGIDIVSLQLFVTAGGNLMSLPVFGSLSQHGHAIECRLCAEDPQNGFFPEHGTVRLWRTQDDSLPESKDIRFETAIDTGSEVSIHFDSMIAKIVVWAPTRSIAIEKMIRALSYTVCLGLKTNQSFLRSCLLHPAFKKLEYTTSFIPDNLESLLSRQPLGNVDPTFQSLAGIPCLFLRSFSTYLPTVFGKRPFSSIRSGFRNQYLDPVNGQANIIKSVGAASDQRPLLCQWSTGRHLDPGQYEAILSPMPEPPMTETKASKSAVFEIAVQYNSISNAIREQAQAQQKKGRTDNFEIVSCQAAVVSSKSHRSWIHADLRMLVNGKMCRVHLATKTCDSGMSTDTHTGQGQHVYCYFPAFGFNIEYQCFNMLSYCESIRAVVEGSDVLLKNITAPMPCKILSVLKEDGEEVSSGDIVIVIESMKMEMSLPTLVGGKFEAVVMKGDVVNEGKLLCRVT